MATASKPQLIDVESIEATNPSKMEIVSDSLATGVIFALALTIVQRAVGFVRGILFCRFMTDQQLGQWSMVWSFLMLLAPLAVLGLPGCFGKYVEFYRGRGQLKTFVARIAWVSTVMTAGLAITIFAFPAWYSWVIFRDATQVNIVRALAVALLAVTAMNFLVSLVESLRQVRLVTMMRFVLGVCFATIGCSLLVVWEDKTMAATVGYGVSCLVAAIPAVWFLRKYRGTFAAKGPSLSQSELWRRIAPFAIWLWCSNLFHNMFEVSDRYMLVHCSPVTADLAQGFVGQYHSGRVLPLLFVSIATMLGGLLMPYMSAEWEKGNRDSARVQLNWTIKLIAIGFSIAGLAVIVASPLLFDGILQGRYNDGRAVLPLTLVYCTWFSLYTVGQDYLWVAEKGRLAFAAVAMGLFANLILNYGLIPVFGLWGAVAATTAANALTLATIYLFNHRSGCTTDLGVWVTGLIPLVMVLPPWIGAVILAGVMVIGARTRWVFSDEEKVQLHQVWKKARRRLFKSA